MHPSCPSEACQLLLPRCCTYIMLGRVAAADTGMVQDGPQVRRKGCKASPAQPAGKQEDDSQSPGSASDRACGQQPLPGWPGSSASGLVEDGLARMRSEQMNAGLQQASQAAKKRQAQARASTRAAT